MTAEARAAAVSARRLGELIWLAALALLVIACAAVGVIAVLHAVDDLPKMQTDFTVFWTAGRVPREAIYDIDAITRAQAWALTRPDPTRPFPYPPTFLFYIEPFSRLPAFQALLLWDAVGVTAFCLAARALVGRVWPLMIASPAFACALIAGQPAFLVGGGLMAALLALPRRPLLAGILFGVLATIKPQILLLVPVGLIVARRWRTLYAALAAGAVIGLVSLIVHGDLWLRWLRMLPQFNHIIENDAWDMEIGVTPKALAWALGLSGTPIAWAIIIAGVALGLWTVAAAFRDEDPLRRYAALCAGYLLVSPYALWYELVLLLPPAVAMLAARGWITRGAGVLAYAFFPKSLAVLATALRMLGPLPWTRAVPSDHGKW